MKFATAFPALAALSSIAGAIPLDQRDLVMLTKTQMVMTTVEVIKTVFADPHNSPATKAPAVQPQAMPTPVPNAQPPVAPNPKPAPVVPSAAPAPKPPKPAVPAPAPAASQAPAPAPQAPPAPSHPNQPTSGSSGSIGGMAAPGQSYSGDLTFYDVGLGACGLQSSPTDHIVAISTNIFDSYGTPNPNLNPVCGRTVNIQYNGQTFPAKVVDRCAGCKEGDLDLSYGFFGDVTNGAWGTGRIHGVHWSWS